MLLLGHGPDDYTAGGLGWRGGYTSVIPYLRTLPQVAVGIPLELPQRRCARKLLPMVAKPGEPPVIPNAS